VAVVAAALYLALIALGAGLGVRRNFPGVRGRDRELQQRRSKLEAAVFASTVGGYLAARLRTK
jgi:hypothetical protein